MTLPDASRLPASLLDVAETLSLDIALKLMEAFPGEEIYFPSYPSEDHHVIAALGKEDGYALCGFLSGAIVYIPNGKTGSVRAEVLALQANGKSRREIARILGVSQRHVRRMANKKKNHNQFDMFD